MKPITARLVPLMSVAWLTAAMLLSSAAAGEGEKYLRLEDCTRVAPVNALGPIESNGSWAQEGRAIVATGAAAPWTIRTAGDPKWTDYRLSAEVTIRKPGPKADYRITNCEYDRYLPREMFPPGTHTGQYRYRYYAGEFDWGSEAAVLVRYRDRESCYRVQLSTEYEEISSGTGRADTSKSYHASWRPAARTRSWSWLVGLTSRCFSTGRRRSTTGTGPYRRWPARWGSQRTARPWRSVA